MEIKKIRMKRIFEILAPRVGFEPTTLRLTAGCSAVELPRNSVRSSCAGIYYTHLGIRCNIFFEKSFNSIPISANDKLAPTERWPPATPTCA